MAFKSGTTPASGINPVGSILPPVDITTIPGCVKYLGILHAIVTSIIKKLNFAVNLGDGIHGHASGNLDGETISFVTPTPANTEFVVRHGLGRVPIGWFTQFQNKAGVLYADNYQEWSPTTVRFKHNVAAVSVTIVLH